MMLSEQQIHDLIAQGEGISLEFKTCCQQLNRDVYQSVCAFLNRHGGFLLLGVRITVISAALHLTRWSRSARIS